MMKMRKFGLSDVKTPRLRRSLSEKTRTWEFWGKTRQLIEAEIRCFFWRESFSRYRSNSQTAKGTAAQSTPVGAIRPIAAVRRAVLLVIDTRQSPGARTSEWIWLFIYSMVLGTTRTQVKTLINVETLISIDQRKCCFSTSPFVPSSTFSLLLLLLLKQKLFHKNPSPALF